MSVIACKPVLFLLAKPPNVFISLIFSLASWIIFHFQDGGDVTNPASLSLCILPRKCKSIPMLPSRAKNLLQNSANPSLFPRMSPGESKSKCKNDFDLHENETACRTHFHMKGFALRLILKQRHKRTQKWPIG